MPARAGSMSPATRGGIFGTRQNAAIGAQAARTVTGRPATQAGWQRFGAQAAPGGGRTAPMGTASSRAGGPQSVQTRQATLQGNQGGWQRFSSQPSRANRGAGVTAPQGQAGWNRFESRSSGGRSSSAPRGGGSAYSESRPPLQMNKPIVRERFGSGGGYGGGGRVYSAPSGGGRNYSAPSGGGRSYSAPSGGGGRGYSAPSGGGRNYSAPSGGGRSYSAPSGGGGRGYSAPSGGSHSGGGGGGRSSSQGGSRGGGGGGNSSHTGSSGGSHRGSH
jgi:hypothetical protein